MKKILSIAWVSALALPVLLSAQASKTRKSHYNKDAYEYIFSWGAVDEAVSSVDQLPVSASKSPLRFSGFFNVSEQFHWDFSKAFGLFSGIGIRNIGFIHHFGDSVRVKQRQYALGVPLAFKLGGMKKNFFFAAGAEMELFFNYKQKVFYNNSKDKFSEWFSPNSDLLNPSLFAEVDFPKGSFIRFRYYLNDFLNENSRGINVNGKSLNYDFTPSSLMYISIGTALDWDQAHHQHKGAQQMRAGL